MITIYTYDWVPGGEGSPRGHVRDIRLRWACEEAGLPYEVKATPIKNRGEAHHARQPFGQVPFIDDDDIEVFESGACLLHIAEKSEVLMPRDAKGRADVLQWVIAALNSVEMVTVPWWFTGGEADKDNKLAGWMQSRFSKLEAVLQKRDWLAAGRFTAADLIMAEVLRVPAGHGQIDEFPKLKAYLDRILARPAFKKAYDDQMAHFENSVAP